jgi:hypothetical protein
LVLTFSPWFPYSLASIYEACDEIVVVNNGYMFPDALYRMGPLPKATEWIKRLDVKGKVTEITYPDTSKMRHSYPLGTQKAANQRRSTPQGEGRWFDVRGLNITAGFEKAITMGADWVLKIDSDEVCYADVSGLRADLEGNPHPISFYQWEFAGLVGGEKSYRIDPPPAKPWIDTVEAIPARPDIYYLGAGAVTSMNEDRRESQTLHAAHLRSANPIWSTEEERIEHFFGRVGWRLYTNDYGYWSDELIAKSRLAAVQLLDCPRVETNIKPPEICYYEDPLEYLEAT